jgi:beta-glucanase (GH16 family)
MRMFSKYNLAALVVGIAFTGCGSTNPPPGGTSGTNNGATGATSGAGGTGSTSGTTPPTSGTTSGTSSGAATVTSGSGGTGTSSGTTSGASTGTASGSSTGATSGSSTGSTSGVSTSGTGGSLAGVIGHPDPTITYPTHTGYSLYLAEEFNQPLDLTNDPNWAWSDGGLDEGSVRFVSSQITFSAGNMLITAINRPAGTNVSPISFAENRTNFAPKAQLSGELRTKYNNYRYGWYEARFKPPTDMTGNSISSLFIFRTPKLQDWREIDIELTPAGNGSPGPGGVGTNVYFFGTPANPNGMAGYNAAHSDGNEMIPVAGLTNNQADFHVYAFEWTPMAITWYVDGVMVRTKKATAAVPIPEQSAKIFMNLWIFGSDNAFGGNTPENNAYPLTATYDYVRFYKLDDKTAEPTYPCSPTPTCVLAADILESKNNPDDGVPNNCIKTGMPSATVCP